MMAVRYGCWTGSMWSMARLLLGRKTAKNKKNAVMRNAQLHSGSAKDVGNMQGRRL